MAISKRLQAIAALVPAHGVVADIGCDHAQLLLHLAHSHRLQRGIGGDIRRGPLAQAEKNLQRASPSCPIILRQGDGLAVITGQHVDTVVIAGLGGHRIVDLLTEGCATGSSGVRCLVLQPHTGGYRVRRWLMERDWEITSEDLVYERQHLYEMMVARQGDGKAPYCVCVDSQIPAQGESLPLELFWALGPLLWQTRHALLPLRWQREWEKVERILVALRDQGNVHKERWLTWQQWLWQAKQVMDRW